MLNYSDLLTLSLPFIAIVISIVTTYINNRYRSIDLAIKYESYLDMLDGEEKCSSFDWIIRHEAKLASSFYLWKSLSRLSDHKRSYFNYASFLVFAFGWIGMGFAPVIKTGAETGAISGAFLIGSVVMLFSSFFMAYVRYEANLYSSFLDLRKEEKHLHSDAAIYFAKEKVFDESIIPVVASLGAAIVASMVFESKIVSIGWNLIILICVLGNNIEIIRNTKRNNS